MEFAQRLRELHFQVEVLQAALHELQRALSDPAPAEPRGRPASPAGASGASGVELDEWLRAYV